MADGGQVDACHVHQSLRQQGEGLLAGSWQGQQAKTAATAELVGQQANGRIAGGNDQGVRRRGRELLANLPFLVNAVMADEAKIGRLRQDTSARVRPPRPASSGKARAAVATPRRPRGQSRKPS